MIVFGQSDCIRAKVVVFRQKWLYSVKVVVFYLFGSIRAKVVLIGQSGCIRAKAVVFRQKWLYSVKAVVFGQK